MYMTLSRICEKVELIHVKLKLTLHRNSHLHSYLYVKNVKLNSDLSTLLLLRTEICIKKSQKCTALLYTSE